MRLRSLKTDEARLVAGPGNYEDHGTFLRSVQQVHLPHFAACCLCAVMGYTFLPRVAEWPLQPVREYEHVPAADHAQASLFWWETAARHA